MRALLPCAAFLALSSAAFAQSASPPNLAALADQALGLRRSSVVSIDLIGRPGEAARGIVDLGGQPAFLELTPHSVLAEGFRLRLQDETGAWFDVPPAPEVTYRGSFSPLPGSLVAASWLEDGLHARVLLADGGELWIQPLQPFVPQASARHHVVFRGEDVKDVLRVCGSDLLELQRPGPWHAIQPGAPGGQARAGAQVAELACDADFEYFQARGSTGAVQSRIASVINTVNLQYEAEVGLTHMITTVLVRTSSSQPYTSTDAGTLLNQFRSEWNANQSGVQRDVAQLFTGKEVNGGTIGIAWLGVVCNSSYGYSMVQSDFNGVFSCATDLSAHELGHNWSADHCSCTSNTMNPYITCANTFHPNLTIPEITSFRDSLSCLDGGGTGGTPTSVHVDSITVDTIGRGRGQKSGRATVLIVDDLGNPVSGATVTGTFTGNTPEVDAKGTTNGSGVATLTAMETAKGKVKNTFCVTDVSAALPYAAGDNTENCDQN